MTAAIVVCKGKPNVSNKENDKQEYGQYFFQNSFLYGGKVKKIF